jgi:hypothetical protein
MLNNNYSVSPNPLEVKGDSILIAMSANIPAKSINPKANVQFTPYLKTPKGDVPLKSITVGGEAVTDNVDFKINSKTGGKVTFTDKIPYNEDLKRVTLYPDFAVKLNNEYKKLETPGVPAKALAEGTITTPLLAMPVTMGAFDVTEYTSVTESKMVNIYFPKDVDRFNAGFRVSKQLDNKSSISELRKLLKSDPNWVVKGIAINAYASPDGELQRNEGLSKGREESTYTYFKRELKKLGFTEVNDVNFTRGYTLAEDWAGYAKNVEGSTHPDKDGVLAIVKNNTISDEEREGLIKRNYPKFWEATKNTLLPPLRRAELVVKGQKPLKGDDELRTYSDKLDQLNEIELLHLASISNDTALRGRAYSAYMMKAPTDWKGHNDMGALLISQNRHAEAMAHLEEANTLSPENPAVLSNMGAAYAAKNDYTNAEKMYKAAAAKGGDANYGLGVIAIRRGNYSDAVNLIGKSGRKDFNFALAQLLNGNPEQAKQTLDEMKPEDMGWKHYYLRAIAGSRMSNQDVVTTNLTRAVQMNADVRTLAKEDVEFLKFWNNPAFEGSIR